MNWSLLRVDFMSYAISIIIPIFNVEPFLGSALDSIVNQTFDFGNIEVLMVNDCSTDNSGVIIDEYSNKYENFIAFHLDKNSGTAGGPRNVGLENANGDYIMFLDSDDELMEDICETLYNKAISSGADIVTGNALCIMSDKQVVDINYNENYYEFNPNKNLEIFRSFRLWGTLYKRSLIKDNNIQFIRASTNDDTHFVYNCYLHASSIIYLNDYYGVKYYIRDSTEFESLTHKMSKFNIMTTFDAFIEIIKLISISKPSKDYYYDPFIMNIYGRFASPWDVSNKDKKEIFEKIREYINYSDYVIKLPIHHKILHFFVIFKLDSLLCIVQSVYSSFITSKFSKKFLIPKFINRDIE